MKRLSETPTLDVNWVKVCSLESYQAQEVAFQATLVIVYVTVCVTQTSMKKEPKTMMTKCTKNEVLVKLQSMES